MNMIHVTCRRWSMFLWNKEHVQPPPPGPSQVRLLGESKRACSSGACPTWPWSRAFQPSPRLGSEAISPLCLSPSVSPRPRSPWIPSKARIKGSAHELKTSAHAKVRGMVGFFGWWISTPAPASCEERGNPEARHRLMTRPSGHGAPSKLGAQYDFRE